MSIYDNSSEESSTFSSDYKFFTTPVSIASQVFAISVVILTDLVANLVMCYTVYRTAKLRTVTNIFTVNLGIVDLSVGVLILPMWIVSTVHLSWPLPDVVCHITAFMTVLLLTCSIYTLAGISLDRYFSICHPLRYPAQVTQKRVLLSVGVIWVVSTLLAGAPLVGWGQYSFRPQTIPICNPEWVSETSYTIVLVLIGLTIPLVAMLFSYIMIICVAKRQASRIAEIQNQLQNPWITSKVSENERKSDLREKLKKRRFFSQSHRSRSMSNFKRFSAVTKNLKTLKTVFIVVGAFFLCWGPYVCLNFWSVNNELEAIPYVADLLTTFLAFTNSSLSPVIFTVLNKDFRQATNLIMRRLLCFWRKDMVFSLRNHPDFGSRYESLLVARAKRLRNRQNNNNNTDNGELSEDCESKTVSPTSTVSTTDGTGLLLQPQLLITESSAGRLPPFTKLTTPITSDNKEESLPGTLS